ncbi:MAG: DUF4336 domain-containing protein [Bdellovibrionales bacterium]|nr:DUF4336 domain-containing protein [Bdellovibrionales bacterium]
MELKNFGQNIYHVDIPFQLLNIHIGNRMSVILLQDGKVWVHSPITPHQDLVDHLNQLGEVSYVIAPNQFHHVHLPNFHSHFPEAKYFATLGLPHKRSGFAFDVEMQVDQSFPWKEEIESLMLDGMPKVNEWVYLHKPSKTLIVTDLLFHFVDFPNWRTSWFAKLNRSHNKPHWSWFYFLNISDRKAFSQSLQKLEHWDFDKVLLSHGAPIYENAKERVMQGLRKII